MNQKKKDLKKLSRLGHEFSRNKFYEFCKTPLGRRLLFLKRQLDSISDDLIKTIDNGGLTINKKGNTYALTIMNNKIAYKRSVILEKEEIEYLKKNPRIKNLLKI